MTTSLDGGIGVWELDAGKSTLRASCRVNRRIDCVAVAGKLVFVGGPASSGSVDGGVDVISIDELV